MYRDSLGPSRESGLKFHRCPRVLLNRLNDAESNLPLMMLEFVLSVICVIRHGVGRRG